MYKLLIWILLTNGHESTLTDGLFVTLDLCLTDKEQLKSDLNKATYIDDFFVICIPAAEQ